ncbi:MAG: hypothetical protein WBR18_02930 [Anaerolineales bacterium]
MESKPPDPQELLDLKLVDLLAQWPSSAQSLITYRMACVGCDFAGFHTARQAIRVYQLDENSFVRTLQDHLELLPGECSSDPPHESS